MRRTLLSTIAAGTALAIAGCGGSGKSHTATSYSSVASATTKAATQHKPAARHKKPGPTYVRIFDSYVVPLTVNV